MKRRFSEKEFKLILAEGQDMRVTDLCRKHGILRRTFYKWQKRLSAIADGKRIQLPSEKGQTRGKGDQLLLNETKEKMPHASPFEIVKHLIEAKSLPVTRACLIVGFPRRTWYRWRKIRHVQDLGPNNPDLETRIACVAIVAAAARKYQVPGALIISHSNHRVASLARKEVQRAMIEDLGMKRSWIARMFDRDIRRVRKSVLGK